MHTTMTPKKLTDLRYQDNVLHLKDGQSVETEARCWFKEVMDTTDAVTCTLIFQESEAESDEETLRAEIKQVWECYTDGGSIDYLYIVK
jgi:hypothetical protein